MTVVRVPSLIEILAEIGDKRQKKGKRHPLEGMLALGVVGMMCGYERVSAIAEWGKNYGEKYQKVFGFERHGYPALVTWYRVFGGIDIEEVERKIAEWVEMVLSAMPPEGEMEGVSIDGKTLRGSKKRGAKNSHLLSAVSHRLGLALGQIAVDEKTNEIGVVEDLLLQLVLTGRIVTTDALLTQKAVAQTIVDKQGDYVLPVKENQELTYQAIKDWFDAQPPRHLANRTAYHVEKGHGRLTHWQIEVTSALNGYLDWPELAQCFKLTRRNVYLSTGEISSEIHYGISSLTPQEAAPANLLLIKRQHWCIENRSHWVRDVTFDEDRSQVHIGHTHQLMAALRNLVLTLLRLAHFHNIASAVRYFAAQPCSALALVFQPLALEE
jgi:predicted transposase YbfD/YdcC